MILAIIITTVIKHYKRIFIEYPFRKYNALKKKHNNHPISDDKTVPVYDLYDLKQKMW